MKISIITVTYNSVATLEATILSVIQQTQPNIEYIIIDGGSTDGTLDVIEKYKLSVSKFISESDKGLYDAINKGIALAEGDVIGILHSDDIYIHHKVLENYARIFETTNCDAVYSDLYYVDRDNIEKITRKWKSGKYKVNSFVNGWMPPHPTFFVRKKLYEQFGHFNTTLKSAADYELMLRMIHKHKIKVAYLPQFTVKMRVGGKSNASVKNRLNANVEDRKAWEMNDLKPKFYTLYLKPLRKIFQFFG
ncbi:MAG: glycosyltransferase [Bacteroidetes bacterium]|nr:glycosyltransferase [Bacteroidota bacterium]